MRTRTPADLVDMLYADRSFLHSLVGSPGYSLPPRDGLVAYDLQNPEDVARVTEKHKVTFNQAKGVQGNVFVAHESLQAPKLAIKLYGSDSLCVLGPHATVDGLFELRDRSRVVIAGSDRPRALSLKIHLHSPDQRFFWGFGASSEGTHTSYKGNGVAIVIGDDCMFSWGVWLRPSDMHLMIDPVSGSSINEPVEIIIEPHVWIGQNALVLKGARIGAGSIVGGQSVVPGRTYRPLRVYAGNPVRELRAGISWDRETTLTPEAVERVRQICALYDDSARVDANAEATHEQNGSPYAWQELLPRLQKAVHKRLNKKAAARLRNSLANVLGTKQAAAKAPSSPQQEGSPRSDSSQASKTPR